MTVEHNMNISATLLPTSYYFISSLMPLLQNVLPEQCNFILEHSHRYVSLFNISHASSDRLENTGPQCFSTWRVIKRAYISYYPPFVTLKPMLSFSGTYHLTHECLESVFSVLYSTGTKILPSSTGTVSGWWLQLHQLMCSSQKYSCLHHTWSLNLGPDRFQAWCYTSCWNRDCRGLIWYTPSGTAVARNR